MNRKIVILPDEKVIFAEDGENLLQILASVGVALVAACGGKGTCGKCRVRLLSGRVSGTEADERGEILACRASVCEDITLALLQTGTETETVSARATVDGRSLAAALDVGTTTLALSLIDPATGATLERCTALNPQGVLGADVLSRIEAWGKGKGTLLQRLLLDRVREMLARVCADGQALTTLTVAANTTMLHLFLNVDPTPIGVYPFTPRFTDTQWVSGRDLGLPAERVCLLPSVSAYVGSDVVAGALACDLDGGGTSLLVDIGTNGEIMLSHGGKLYATSTAAGPALEGACIECGMGGVTGAVDHVSVEDGELRFSTVGGGAARGICGSGLIDLIALLLREGLLCESGAFEEDCDSPLSAHLCGDRFYLCEDVYISQKDIRQYQLAKSAIASGILVLLDACSVRAEEVSRVLIAGGLGYYMDLENAAQTGLLPRALCARAESVGNAALTGACGIAADADRLARAEALARRTQIVELGGSAAFSEAYMMNMMLEEV